MRELCGVKDCVNFACFVLWHLTNVRWSPSWPHPCPPPQSDAQEHKISFEWWLTAPGHCNASVQLTGMTRSVVTPCYRSLPCLTQWHMVMVRLCHGHVIMSPCHHDGRWLSLKGPVSAKHRRHCHRQQEILWGKNNIRGVVLKVLWEWFDYYQFYIQSNKLSNINDIINWNDFWKFSKSARWCRL